MNSKHMLADVSIHEEYVVELGTNPHGPNPAYVSFVTSTPTVTRAEKQSFPSHMQALVFRNQLIDSLRSGGAYHVRELRHEPKKAEAEKLIEEGTPEFTAVALGAVNDSLTQQVKDLSDLNQKLNKRNDLLREEVVKLREQVKELREQVKELSKPCACESEDEDEWTPNCSCCD